ncbi:serine hydrolase [soil metagenome]
MTRRLLLAFLLITPMLQGCTTADPPDPIAAIAAGLPGEVGLFAKHLETGETLQINADSRFPTASVIKVAVLAEAFRRAAEGTLSFDERIAVPSSVRVGGAGILGELDDGVELTLGDLTRLMIVLSDNSATNVLVERLGAARINETMRGLGLEQTRIFRPTFRDGRPDVDPELEREFGLGMSTPREMATLMERIVLGEAVSAGASGEMRAILNRQQDRLMIPRRLPAGVRVGNKTGTDQEKQPDTSGRRGHIRNDVAIVETPAGVYVLAIFIRRIHDPSWTPDNAALLTGADLSRAVYDHFTRGQ